MQEDTSLISSSSGSHGQLNPPTAPHINPDVIQITGQIKLLLDFSVYARILKYVAIPSMPQSVMVKQVSISWKYTWDIADCGEDRPFIALLWLIPILPSPFRKGILDSTSHSHLPLKTLSHLLLYKGDSFVFVCLFFSTEVVINDLINDLIWFLLDKTCTSKMRENIIKCPLALSRIVITTVDSYIHGFWWYSFQILILCWEEITVNHLFTKLDIMHRWLYFYFNPHSYCDFVNFVTWKYFICNNFLAVNQLIYVIRV